MTSNKDQLFYLLVNFRFLSQHFDTIMQRKALKKPTFQTNVLIRFLTSSTCFEPHGLNHQEDCLPDNNP